MPSIVVTANTVAQTILTTPSLKTVYLERIDIDHAGINAVQLTLQDVFTASVTAAVAVPGVNTESRLIISAVPGIHYELVDGMDKIKSIGVLQVISNVTDADCDITVVWA